MNPEPGPLFRWNNLSKALLRPGSLEQGSQIDAAVTELWESHRIGVARIQVGGSAVGRKQDETSQKRDDIVLMPSGKPLESISRFLGFPAMPKDHFPQIDATPIVAVRGGGPDTPERFRHHFHLGSAIVVDLVKVGSQIMPLEVGKNIADNK